MTVSTEQILDVDALRAQIPALAEGAAHFDGPGGTQVPEPVARAVYETLRSAVANRGTVTRAEQRAEEIVVAARSAMADLLGADPRGIVFGRSATQLNYDVARALAKTWSPGDEIVVTRLDHDANIRPWVQAAEGVGATARFADFDPSSGELTTQHIEEQLTDRTRLVAMTAASNLIGTRPDVASILRLVHDAGAVGAVDAVHATAHFGIDAEALGADLLVCSPYKFMGPHCGVLAARVELLESLSPDKLLPSSNAIPERFEWGTLPYELLAGGTAVVDLIAGLAPRGAARRREAILASMETVESHEDQLRHRIEGHLISLGATIHSRAVHRTPTLFFSLPGVGDHDVRQHLAERNINAPNGNFYAIECSRHLGLDDAGAVRVGLAPYNSDDDVDRLLVALSMLVGA